MTPQEKYDATHTKKITFKFNLGTDADILEFLDSLQEPKQTLVKRLIREYMKGEQK